MNVKNVINQYQQQSGSNANNSNNNETSPSSSKPSPKRVVGYLKPAISKKPNFLVKQQNPSSYLNNVTPTPWHKNSEQRMFAVPELNRTNVELFQKKNLQQYQKEKQQTASNTPYNENRKYAQKPKKVHINVPVSSSAAAVTTKYKSKFQSLPGNNKEVDVKSEKKLSNKSSNVSQIRRSQRSSCKTPRVKELTSMFEVKSETTAPNVFVYGQDTRRSLGANFKSSYRRDRSTTPDNLQRPRAKTMPGVKDTPLGNTVKSIQSFYENMSDSASIERPRMSLFQVTAAFAFKNDKHQEQVNCKDKDGLDERQSFTAKSNSFTGTDHRCNSDVGIKLLKKSRLAVESSSTDSSAGESSGRGTPAESVHSQAQSDQVSSHKITLTRLNSYLTGEISPPHGSSDVEDAVDNEEVMYDNVCEDEEPRSPVGYLPMEGAINYEEMTSPIAPCDDDELYDINVLPPPTGPRPTAVRPYHKIVDNEEELATKVAAVELVDAEVSIYEEENIVTVVPPPPLPANNTIGRRSKFAINKIDDQQRGAMPTDDFYEVMDVGDITPTAQEVNRSISKEDTSTDVTDGSKSKPAAVDADEDDRLEDFNAERNKTKRKSKLMKLWKRDKNKARKSKEPVGEADVSKVSTQDNKSESSSSTSTTTLASTINDAAAAVNLNANYSYADDVPSSHKHPDERPVSTGTVDRITIRDHKQKKKKQEKCSGRKQPRSCDASQLYDDADVVQPQKSFLFSSDSQLDQHRNNNNDDDDFTAATNKQHSTTSLQPTPTVADVGVYESLNTSLPPEIPVRMQSLKRHDEEVNNGEDDSTYVQPADSPRRPPPVPQRQSSDIISKENLAPPPIPPKDMVLEEDDDVCPDQIVPPCSISRDRGTSFLHSEPLYQIYRNRQMTRVRRPANRNKSRASFKKAIKNQLDEDWKSEIMNDEMTTNTLWRVIPEVENSGILTNMSPEDIKLQQAQFEVITSQASYLRSLNVLVDHFMKDSKMMDPSILSNPNRRIIFSNVERVHEVEQRFLRELENHFWNELKLSRVCNLIAKFCKEDFDVYERYIQNQVYQERKLNDLQKNDAVFTQHLNRLEASPACNRLSLMSFLLLPFQRACRLPLLVEAIVNAADYTQDKHLLKQAKHTLGQIRKLVKKCNECAKKMQQTEQIAELARIFEYPSHVKMFALVSQSRYLVKKGEAQITFNNDSKKGSKVYKLWLFLFNDVILIARKKNSMLPSGGPPFEVIDWAKRSLMYVNEMAYSENTIFLVLLENQSHKKSGKRVELSIHIPSQNEHSRWLQALIPPTEGDGGEKIYEEWDCPQLICIKPYQAVQPDEMSIDVGDVVKVTKKTSDGWSFGERLGDGESGWIPQNYCDEIEDEHVRARNMKHQYKAIISHQ